jgi:hypothetical protein
MEGTKKGAQANRRSRLVGLRDRGNAAADGSREGEDVYIPIMG